MAKVTIATVIYGGLYENGNINDVTVILSNGDELTGFTRVDAEARLDSLPTFIIEGYIMGNKNETETKK